MVNVGIVGTGHLGKIHIQQWKKITNANLVGFYDINPETRRKVAKEFLIKPYESLDKLLNDIDALDIVTPTTTHYEIAAKAIKNFKHVFIEKPVTSTLEEAEKLKKLVREGGVVAQVGFVERFNPAFLAAKEIGLKPLFIETHRLAPWNIRGTDVSVVHDLMIHDLDIILHLIPYPLKSIRANGVAIISETPDIANARLEFNNGTVVNITASRISLKKMRKMRIFQSNAYISIDFLDKKTEIYQIVESYELNNEENQGFPSFSLNVEGTNKHIVLKALAPPQVNSIQLELQHFVDAIINKKEPPVTIYDAYNSLKLATQITEKINASLTIGFYG